MFVAIAACIFMIACTSNSHSDTGSSDSTKGDYELVWSDEFDYEGAPDSTKWIFDIGDACDLPQGCGWGNQELQHYTDDASNVHVKNGNLVITLRNEQIGNSNHSSARIKTLGKGDWTYGKMVTRAKLPKGLGVWPAIWMMPTESKYGGWPKSGEIDIMENVGYAPDTIVSTAHTGSFNHMIGTHKNGSVYIPDNGDVFHDYILEWDADQYACYVDDQHVFTYKNDGTGSMSWPFDQDFHLIINLAFGGNWAGKNGVNPEVLPASLIVDYVKVYQKE